MELKQEFNKLKVSTEIIQKQNDEILKIYLINVKP